MIILRYLSRELLQSTFAVTLVLMVVIMSGRFVKYLADAAAGKFDSAVLLSIMFYRLPGFLELILPLGFMVGILMAYGRLYAEQEMTVLSSCGMSQRRLLLYTYCSGALIALLVGICSFWLSPLGLQKAEQIIQQQKNRNEFETMKPGRFQIARNGNTVSYMESQNEEQQLQQVFIATMGVAAGKDVVTIKAESAERIDNPDYQQRYLLLRNGTRYTGRPGEADYRITEFDTLAEHLPQVDTQALTSKKINSQTTATLLASGSAEAQAALQWRISIPLLILVITLLGVAMSYTTPRRGRYAMLFPAILLYLIYLVLLNAARSSVEEQSLSPAIGLWWVHLLFIAIAVTLFALRTGGVARWLQRNVSAATSRADTAGTGAVD